MKNSRLIPPPEERIIPVTLKVYHRQRRVDCEYRFDETDGKYHLFCVETKYGDIELDTRVFPYRPIGIKKLRESYNASHKDTVEVVDKSLLKFTEIKL